MSHSRRAGGAVRGPSSALTSFLAGLGVEPSASLTTWGDTSAIPTSDNQDEALAHDGPIIIDDSALDPAGAVTARTVTAGPSQVGEGTPVDEDAGIRRRKPPDYDSDAIDSSTPRKKVKRASSIDSEDLDGEFSAGPGTSAAPAPQSSMKVTAGAVRKGPLKDVGEFMECGVCGNKFTVTAYTKEHPVHSSTWLCVKCCYDLGIDPFAKIKKVPKKKAPVKEDRAKVVHYEARKGVAPLGDICIHLVGKFIEDVEQLGDIGGINMDKVCKIISKSRRLTPETASLFYSADRKDLRMYDCTLLAHDAYIALAKLCPNLESLYLHLCGQLATESVITLGESLKHLKRLELFGPFLVRQQGWMSFFKSVGDRLEGFLVTQSPRIDLETIETLVTHCRNLTQLRLAEVGQLKDDLIVPLAQLKKLHLLDLSAPGTPLTDDGVIALLSQVGEHLISLNLSDNPDLTDAILPSIVKYCPNLRRLSLRNVVELTDEGVSAFFISLKSLQRPGLEIIDLEKGHDLQGGSLRALVEHSGDTIEHLNILGWREADAESIGELAKCSQLRELDLGWCREVTDFTIKEILESCGSIKLIRVWGCNQLTDAVPRKKGVSIIGIETHTI